MLLILFVTLLFTSAKLLQAEEFPGLLKHVEVVWGGRNLTSQFHTRQTMSFNGTVRTFIFCGPFQTSGKDGKCRSQYRYQYYPSPNTKLSATGALTGKARLISTINETYSCMSFHNLFPDFMMLYKETELNSLNSYRLSYECETTDSAVVVGFERDWIHDFGWISYVLILLIIVLVGAYKSGAQKGEEVSAVNESSVNESSGAIESSKVVYSVGSYSSGWSVNMNWNLM